MSAVNTAHIVQITYERTLSLVVEIVIIDIIIIVIVADLISSSFFIFFCFVLFCAALSLNEWLRGKLSNVDR